ncbi:growth/differentiation factor 7 [Discoglossus pictus]
MDLRKAAALCLGLWSAWLWAAAVTASPHRLSRAGAARRALLAATIHRDPQHHLTSRKEPTRKGTVVPHEYMLSLYKRLSSNDYKELNRHLARNKTGVNTITSFVDQGHDDVAAQTSEQKYLFDISTLSAMDDIVGAELRILWKVPENTSFFVPETSSLVQNGSEVVRNSQVRIQLYTCPNIWEEAQLLDSRPGDLLDTKSSKWEVFNVWKVMENKKSAMLGEQLCFLLRIVADITMAYLQPTQLGFNRQVQQPSEKALLVVSSHSKKRENLFKEIRDQIKSMENPKMLDPPDSGQQQTLTKRRRKRTTLPTRTSNGRGHGKKSKTRCSKKPLHVNFKELGWDDWIIAPLDYEAYHCEGMCDFPLRSHLEPTNHAIIQTLMNSMDPESTPPSCCVPSKLSPISILYIDSGNNVVYKQYEDMVVESCGCR